MDIESLGHLFPKLPAGQDAVLFMCATSPMLTDALNLLRGWDFSYRTSFVWVRDRPSISYHVRQKHELLLMAERGDIPEAELEDRPVSWYFEARRKHGQKPDYFRNVIAKMYPDMPRVQLFPRQPVKGWDTWGELF